MGWPCHRLTGICGGKTINHGIHGKKNEKKIVVLNYFRVFRGRIRFMVFPFYDSVVK